MKLNAQSLKDRKVWEDKGYKIPSYDRPAMIEATINAPEWVHFGAGNLFKAFLARDAEELLNAGVLNKGIIAVEGFDPSIVAINNSHDNLALAVTLKHDGSIDKTVVGSIAETVLMDPNEAAAWEEMKRIMSAPSLQMASFTITEKGYAITDAAGELLPLVKEDFENGPEAPKSYLGKAASLLYTRFLANKAPVALVSMDNCSHNGEKLQKALMAYAKAWAANGKVSEDFVKWLSDDSAVSFPWTMIDKITPRPDESVKEMLAADGLEDVDPIKTDRGSFVAPFVNAEETEYLVVEDKFPNGRPALSEAGILFTDRDTVNKVETMKVTTCLNPLHTAMSIFGVLLDYNLISTEMKDEDIVALIKTIGYKEGLPVVVDPKILNPKEFIDTVIEVRFPNPFMPDAPQRIATDTSQKLSVRFGNTIKKYMADETLDVNDLKLIPLVYAGWIRYLLATDDNGKGFELSADPLHSQVLPVLKNISLGDQVTVDDLAPILTNANIFGLDLVETGLAETVVEWFNKLNAGKGAVRKTLHEAVKGDE